MEQFHAAGLHFQFGTLNLKIRGSFRTAHTSTTERNNFIVAVTLDGVRQEAEAGLPPKKPKCYLADVNDCYQAMQQYRGKLQKAQNDNSIPIVNLPQGYFRPLLDDTKYRGIFMKALSVLNTISQPQFRACKSALEFAILGLWSKLNNLSLNEAIFSQRVKSGFKTFFTLSYDEDQEKIVEEAKSGLKYSRLLKIKMANSVPYNQLILQTLTNQKLGDLWVIDANASWSVQTALQMAKFIKESQIEQKILYLEQPFPLGFVKQQWMAVRDVYSSIGIKIMADESFSTSQDIDNILGLCDAVNVKIQKTGGLTQAITAIRMAQQKKLDVWIGSMISSFLGCSQAYQLYPLCQYGDLDGGWLTVSPYSPSYNCSQGGLLENTFSIGIGSERI